MTRYWHTLRWLKPVQWYGRARFLIHRPRPNGKPAPAMREPTASWRACARSIRLLSPASMQFLGVTRELAQPGDWNRADWPKLWLYNAHYFDDLVASDAAARGDWHHALIARWVAENPPVTGYGWEPYPLSLRIVNWIKWATAGNDLSAPARHSLAVQVRQLVRRLEVHLQANHLWANAKALVFAGAAYQGAESATWLAKGLQLIERELDEQILADGGHVERSPMYHAIVLEDLLDLLQLASVFPQVIEEDAAQRWQEAAQRMLHTLKVMSHPDGDIAMFNDAAIGTAPAHAALRAYASELGIEADSHPLPAMAALPDTGYVRLEAGPAVLIADVGVIGPDYQPGHAHADTLSFELSLHGQRLLVNAGTSTYEASALRLWQRGSAAHNTVCVDGRNSSDVWGNFRVARRARPHAVRWHTEAACLALEAAHDGFRHLPGKVGHWRRWELSTTGLRVIDRLVGHFAEARARFRFAPGVVVSVDHGARGTACAGKRQLAWHASGARNVRVVGESWYPGFGQEAPCQVLELILGPGEALFELTWDA